LRGNAGVVGARQPEREIAAHAMPAEDDVHLGLLEHVTHVEATGDVGRRQKQAERVAHVPLGRRGRVEEPFIFPIVGPARLNRARLVRLRKFVWHVLVSKGPIRRLL